MLLIINLVATKYNESRAARVSGNKWKMANFLGYSSQTKLGPSLIKVTFEASGLKYHFFDRNSSTGFYADLRGATTRTTQYEIVRRFIPKNTQKELF